MAARYLAVNRPGSHKEAGDQNATISTAMIIANLSFLQPTTVRRFVDPIAARISLALVGKKVG